MGAQQIRRDSGGVIFCQAAIDSTEFFDRPIVTSLHPGPRFGYGLTQAFTNGPDLCYKAIIGAVKAAVGRAQLAEEVPLFTLAIPVVVFEGRLFECRLDNDGETTLDEVGMGTLWWKNRIDSFDRPRIRIVTESALVDFVGTAAALADYILIRAGSDPPN